MNAIDLNFKIPRVSLNKVLEKRYARQKRKFKRVWRLNVLISCLIFGFWFYLSERHEFLPVYQMDLQLWGLVLLGSTILLIIAIYQILKSAENLGSLKNINHYLAKHKIKKDQWIGEAKLSINETEIRFQRAKFKVGFKWEEQKGFNLYPDHDYLLLTWSEDQFLLILRECMTDLQFDQVEKFIALHRMPQFGH